MTTRRAKPTPALRLNRIVSIEKPTIARDNFGSELRKWIELAEVWANVRPAGAEEQFRQDSNKEQALRRAKMRIRWRDDVYEVYRVIYDGLIWDIEGIEEIGFRRELELSISADVSRAVNQEVDIEPAIDARP